jgi:methyl-accepting chemotaxis protein
MVQALNALMKEADAGLSDVGRVMGAIAEGDLGQRVEVRYHGAFGRLASAVNRTADQLAGIVRGIQQSADAINTAAGEIASGNTDLSRRTESQAANLEETAASMEELTSTVRQNADSARQADQLAKTAGEVAGNGGRVVEDVVTTMASIREASSRIADIIGVIDGIAFQTNILALNAAVEAARAGEQGAVLPWWPRSALAGPAFGWRGQGNQAAHRRVVRTRRAGFHAGGLRRYHDA